MKDKQLLVKRDVKDGLPKESGIQVVICRSLEKDILTTRIFYGSQDQFDTVSPVTHWYEPTTLLSLL